MSAHDGSKSGVGRLGAMDGAGQGGKTFSGGKPGSDGRALDHERLRTLSAEINRRFPLQLDDTALVLYDLDPEHLQVQWFVTPDDFSSARGAFPGASADLRQVLRLCRLDGEGKTEVVDRVVAVASASTLQGHHRFAPERFGAEYECELGLESGDGGWLMLVRSNRARLAGRSPLEPGDAPEADRTRVPGPEGAAEPCDRQAHPVEPALAADGEPLYPVFPSPDSGTAPSALPAGDAAAMPPPLLPSTRYPGQSATAASLPLYDPRAALSSAELHGAARERADVEIRAELVVQGSATPGALVELFGLTLKAGEDGRFSLRYPVADPLILSLALGGHPVARADDAEPEKL